MRFSIFVLIVPFIAVTLDSCSIKGGKHIREGEIHYTIEYLGNIGTLPKEVLPKNLIVSFKDDKILFSMISTLGSSGIMNLSNPEKGIYDTYFSLFSMKYYYAAKKGEEFPGFEAMDGMELRKTDKISDVCGYRCRNAEATFPTDRSKVFQIWYTDEIKVENPNAGSPFSDLDGVLMSFFFLIGHSEMHFTAEAVYKKKIPDLVFDRRQKFQKASRKDIIRFINKMLML